MLLSIGSLLSYFSYLAESVKRHHEPGTARYSIRVYCVGLVSFATFVFKNKNVAKTLAYCTRMLRTLTADPILIASGVYPLSRDLQTYTMAWLHEILW